MNEGIQAELIGGPEDGMLIVVPDGCHVLRFALGPPLIAVNDLNDLNDSDREIPARYPELQFYREKLEEKRPDQPWRYHLRKP